jgi:chitodextrinase
MVFLLLVSMQAVSFAEEEIPVEGVDWNVTFLPYKNSAGQIFVDARNDQGNGVPSRFDLASVGSAGSAFYAIKSENLYFRMVLAGDPRDNKAGGFSNDFRAVVQFIDKDNKLRGSVGLNGTSPISDSLFVSFYHDSSQTIQTEYYQTFPFEAEYATDFVRVLPSPTSGLFYLDMMVPLETIRLTTEDFFNEHGTKLVFGTSTRGSLLDITRDSILGSTPSYDSLAMLKLSESDVTLGRSISKVMKGSNPPFINVEQQYELTYTIRNNGMSNLDTVEMVDMLDSRVEILTPNNENVTIDNNSNELIWKTGPISSAATKTMQLTVRFTPDMEGRFVFSESATARTTVDGIDFYVDDFNALETGPVRTGYLMTITSSEMYDEIVVTSPSPMIRGTLFDADGPVDETIVYVKIHDGVTSKTYQTIVDEGVWTLDTSKVGAGAFISGKTYELTAYVTTDNMEFGSDSATIRYEKDESRITINDTSTPTTDGYVLTNNLDLILAGTTTAPLESIITLRLGGNEEMIEVVSAGKWAMDPSSGGLSYFGLGDGTILVEAFVEGKFLSGNLQPNVIYTSLILKLDTTAPELSVNEESLLEPMDKPMISGTGENGDDITIIVDVNEDNEFSDVAPDYKYTAKVVNGVWSVVIDKVLSRGTSFNAMITATDAAKNSSEPITVSFQTTASAPSLSVTDYLPTLLFQTGVVELSGTSNLSFQPIRLQLRESASGEIFNYYAWTDSEGTWSINTYEMMYDGDYLRNGSYSYTLSPMNSLYASVKVTGAIKVEAELAAIAVEADIPVITQLQKTLQILGSVSAGDTIDLTNTLVTITLTSTSNSSVKVSFVAAVDEDLNFSVQEEITMASGTYRLSASLVDRALNVIPFSATTPILVTIDVSPPSLPSGLATTLVTKDSITIKWNASTDFSGVSEYHIYLDGEFLDAVESNVLTYKIESMQEFMEYDVQLRVIDIHENESELTTALVVKTLDKTPPSVPADLAESNVTRNGFIVKWQTATDENGSGVSGYDVFVNGTLRSTVVNPTITLANLEEYAMFTVTVRAKDFGGNLSSFSIPLQVRTLDMTPPSIPGSLKSANIKAKSFDISWTASTDKAGVTEYDVYLNGQWFATTPNTMFTVTGLADYTTYKMAVRARDAAGNQSLSTSTLDVRTLDGIAPTVPSGLKDSKITMNGFTLTWNVSTDNVAIQSYDISLDGVVSANVTVSGATTVSHTFTTLKPFQTYEVMVRAKDPSGNVSPQSAPLQVKTIDTAPPTVPVGLVSSAVTATGLRLSWSASTDNVKIDGYDVMVGNTPVMFVSETTAIVSGLKEYTQYALSVHAKDVAGNVSAASTALLVRTLDVTPPSVPKGLSECKCCHI